MSNTSQNIWALIRAILTLGGTFLIGHNLLGKTVDSSTVEIVIGAFVSVGSIIWGLVDKSTGIDTALSALRSALLVLAGVGASFGLLSANTVEAIGSFTLALIPILQSILGKAKVQQLANGAIVAQQVSSGLPGTTPVPNGKTVVAGSPKTVVTQKPAA